MQETVKAFVSSAILALSYARATACAHVFMSAGLVAAMCRTAGAEDVGGGALEKDRPAAVAQAAGAVAEPFVPGQRTFDAGWEFRLKDFAVNFNKVGIGPGGNNNGITTLLGETNGWSRVDVPHDWMLAMPVARSGRNGFRAVGRSHPANSVGWYRKRFTVPGKVGTRPCVWLQFDGIYRDAQFWVNGVYLGRNDSGYIGCRFDVTDLIEYGGAENTVAVRVDASRGEGWWYEGAGIYRHVKLIIKNPDHIRPDGILFRTLKIADGRATVSAEAEVEGEGRVMFELDGVVFEKTLEVESPKLWSPDAPHLHTLVARLVGAGGRVTDEVSLKVGIRQFVFDARRGLLVNGVPTKVKGVCCHGDMGCVGVAVPDALHDFRVKRLKEMGVNADRTCHNPPTPEFLDACDRCGILVMDETRLFASSDEGLSQFRRLVLRDRNHACVVAWSVGNEEHNVQGREVGARMARRMRALAKTLAPDTAVTYGGNNGAAWAGINSVVDVRGVNYVRIGSSDVTRRGFFDAPDRYHAAHPEQPVWGSEEASALSTRGSSAGMGPKDVQLMKDGDHPADNVRFPWVATAEQWWNYAVARDWFAGAMAWTGFDYRGESRWPATVNNFGIMDLCGFPKASYWYYKANWTDEDVLNVWPPWSPGVTNLWVDSNCDEVEVFVNGRSVGRRAGDRLHHVAYPVRYEPGTVEARGTRSGRTVSFRMKTPAAAATLALKADRTTLAADGADATVVDVQALDAEGDEAAASEDFVFFECEGPGKIIGVGNGNPLSHEDDVCADGRWKRRLFNGKCQCVLKAGNRPGELRLRVRLASTGAVSEVVVSIAEPTPGRP